MDRVILAAVDGDPPAAMRYTEARITPFALELLNQIDRNTVNFDRNFDDTLSEPSVLPSAIPNMLVNGATGICCGHGNEHSTAQSS